MKFKYHLIFFWTKLLLLACVLNLILSPISFKRVWARVTEATANQVQRAYEKTITLQMDFVQDTYVELLERNIKKTGQAKFQKPGKFAIVYGGARGREYLSDGKSLWIYKKGSSQVQRHALKQGEIPAEALSFLGGLGNLKEDFVIEDLSDKRAQQLKIAPEAKQRYAWLELTPQKKRSQITWLVMGFSLENHLARELYLLTESGNLSHYRFNQVTQNINLDAADFIFAKPNVQEIQQN